MNLAEKKRRINAVIEIDLYVKIKKSRYRISEAASKGFEKLLKEKNLYIVKHE